MAMSRRTFAAVLTVLLMASVLFVLAPGPAQSVSNPAAAASDLVGASHPAAAPTFTLFNGYDVPTMDFYPGELGGGSLYFSVTDPLDRAVNVTITDPNAARDGVASPAFHYEATLNTTTSTFESYPAGVSYTFPAALPYGGHWMVNFSAPKAGYVDQSISVFVYYTQLATSVGSGATLPGQPLTVFWSLYLVSNDATLYTRATNVTITGHYTGNGTLENFFPQGRLALTPANAGQGEWSGVVPANATPGSQIHFEVSAVTNVSGQIAENESNNITVNVGTLTIRGYGITPAPPNCDLVNDEFFPNGSLIAACILVGALYHGAFTPIPGLPVTVNYWNGTAHVAPVGAPTALTSDASGEAAFTFPATAPPFIEETQYPKFDALNFTVSVPGASTHYLWTQWLNATWTIVGGSTASGVVQVSLDHTNYYVGDIATVTWSIHSSNSSKTGLISAISWVVTGPAAITYQEGILNTTAQSGTFTFPVTSAMAPHTIEVWVYAANASKGFDGYASASVLSPSLLLTPASNYYSAGSTATITAVLYGGGSGVSIQYEVWGYWATGQALLSSGTVPNGSSIQIQVASTAPPTSIEVDAWATVSGQVIASSIVTLDLAQGYSILLGVTTPSSYSDGSYQPGQTVSLSYQVVAVGGVALPQVVTFLLFAEGYPSYAEIQNVGPSGTISYTIPSNAVQGTLVLELEAEGALSAGPCLPTGGCVGIATLPINPHPSFLSMEIGAGSGVTVGWLILLVLVIVLAAVLVLMLLRRGRRRPAASPSTINPPAPPPSTPPAAEWKEPAPKPTPEPTPEPAASDSPPPLPEPPAGSS
jgi:hypothetical protein